MTITIFSKNSYFLKFQVSRLVCVRGEDHVEDFSYVPFKVLLFSFEYFTQKVSWSSHGGPCLLKQRQLDL